MPHLPCMVYLIQSFHHPSTWDLYTYTHTHTHTTHTLLPSYPHPRGHLPKMSTQATQRERERETREKGKQVVDKIPAVVTEPRRTEEVCSQLTKHVAMNCLRHVAAIHTRRRQHTAKQGTNLLQYRSTNK